MDFNEYIGKEVENTFNKKKGILDHIEGKYIFIKYDDKTSKVNEDLFFKRKISFTDLSTDKEVSSILWNEKYLQESIKKEKERNEKAEKEKEQMLIERKKNPNDNLAFKSQICDGGTIDYTNWFKAPCSEILRNFHINKDKHHTWCNECSKCKDFYNGTNTEEDILKEYNKGFLCYECKILLNHEIMAGWDTKNGKPDKPRSWRLKDNHLAILTTVEPNKPQIERIIYSIFLTGNTSQATDSQEGRTKAIDGCYIDLSIEEARQMRYWEYVKEVDGQNPTAWSTGLFRYVSDDEAGRILADIVDIVKKRENEDETKKAKLFLEKFVSSYGGDINNIPQKHGPLAK